MLDALCGLPFPHDLQAPAAFLAIIFPAGVFWPYCAAAVVTIVGLPLAIQSQKPPARGMDKLVPFGRLFFALPLAVFGVEHFTAAKIIASIVPSWIPGHLFWVYLVGVALIAAALSIASGRASHWAATLVGVMLFLFVLLIHIPNVAANLKDRFLWAVALRDLAFSGGALAYGGARAGESRGGRQDWMVTVGRYFIALPALFFGVEQILHPEYVPGIPLNKVTAAWVPGRLFWSYLTGTVLLAAAIGLAAKIKERLAAASLGLMILLVVLFVYLPTLVVRPTDIGNELNFVVDTLMFSGAAFLLAHALPGESTPETLP